ncbi:thiamine pyrophosphate-binding protein [Pollutimonas subterranea]|uniref:Thiamine pyrophosphate-binding protein n=1 Tax=Pollutimonas subterranea TaxID=2045210 RepID=A0A2N4U453_9BURK|nr:thiamine pyrophosphate-binding protein [Pollutimonas subterranea]PLC49791.1 thiamine pyrophosphate-binding protein [Pollutimonas subterranea]
MKDAIASTQRATGVKPGVRTGGRAIVDALRAHGTDRVFCVPGESYLEVLDALYDTPEIELIVAKHEGAAANMAEADGKLTGRPGICMVTRGPGATHASIGVHIAQQDSTPMILFVGQIARDHVGREAFQEVNYQAMFGSLAKWVVEINDADRIPEILARAFHTAVSGRPGPVVISLPEDMLVEACCTPDCVATPLQTPALPTDTVHLITAALAQSERPLVFVGGPNWSAQARHDLAQFAERWDLPVACAFRRQDLLDNRDPHYCGHLSLGMNPKLARRIKNADLILAIGTRLGDIMTDGYSLLVPPQLPQKLIHIHADALELGRVYQADIAVQATADTAVAALASLAEVKATRSGETRSGETRSGETRSGETRSIETRSSWTRSARADQEAFSAVPVPSAEHNGVDLTAVIKHLSRTLPDDAVLTNGAGNYSVWLHRYYEYRGGRTELAPTCGAMGYGLPAAVAAALRNKGQSVVCVAGDGCFLMYPQELATAAEYGASLIVLVVNNGMYGTIRMHQERHHPGRVSGTRLQGPDYAALARSFGAYAEQVCRTEDFAAAFQRAQDAGGLALLELRTDPRQITPAMRLGD